MPDHPRHPHYRPRKWTDTADTFHLGINMAGAISAGAYTAGALDFLIEAVEQWYLLRDTDATVPKHKLMIDVFSGASAGGMCAAIASVMIQAPFKHIWNADDPTVRGTTNRFYESWVNRIDIGPLLGTTDLEAGGPLVSLLDSTVIDQIADYAISPGPHTPRDYISSSLTLFLSLTNVRSIPFVLENDAGKATKGALNSDEEKIAFYADRLQFETVREGEAPLAPRAKPLPLGSSGGKWPLLREAAKATGAFPLFLAPRQLVRDRDDYTHSPWLPVSVTNPAEVPPAWGNGTGTEITTLNIDGGITDNDPLELAHDFLAIHNPAAGHDKETGQLCNPREAEKSNCAVLTIAPFPASCTFQEPYPFARNSTVVGMLPNLLTALISQSRFLGESLTAVVGTTSFSRFVLAPSDAHIPNRKALQCGTLGAFGGFLERGFRAHDYELGRRNAQRFLEEHLVLAEENPIIQAGLAGMTAEYRSAAEREHSRLMEVDGVVRRMYRIVPLVGSAKGCVTEPRRATISRKRLDDVLSLAVDRMHAVAGPLVDELMPAGWKNMAVTWILHLLIVLFGRAKLAAYIEKELGSCVSTAGVNPAPAPSPAGSPA